MNKSETGSRGCVTGRVTAVVCALVVAGIIVCPFAARAGDTMVSVEEKDGRIVCAADSYSAEIDTVTGLLSARRADGSPVVTRGFAVWQVDAGGGARTVPSAGNRDRVVAIEDFKDNIGAGKRVKISFEHSELKAVFGLMYQFYYGAPFFVVRQTVENKSDGKMRVGRTIPLQAEAERGGGFFPGPDPANAWALENGHKIVFDFFVRIVRADEPVFSNWNAAYYDRTTDGTSLVGFLTADKGKVSVRSYYEPEKSVSESGWAGLSSLKAESLYEPEAAVAPGAVFEGDMLYVGVSAEPRPHATLERFADAIAAHYEIKKWERDIPTGWNMWATRYHHDLNEENILENARRAAEVLLPFGMTTFQIDDGYQKDYGDWDGDKGFPHGMGWIAGEIRKLGFTPGLWVQPFCVSSGGRFAREHPDWIAPKNEYGQNLMPQDWEIVDLSNPEVKKWLADLFHKIGYEWGFKFIKIDFIYYALLGKNYYDPDVTAVEAYRDGLKTIRDALPPDTFYLQVGVPTANSVGTADGMRLGLDVTPDWQDDEGPYAQGIKPMVRNLARRYYLNHRVWILHPDMFYLGSPEEEERWGGSRVTLEEARCYATLASLMGGIVKIGDSFIGLNDEQIDLLRRLLPVYHGAARPVDLFEYLYPQIWHLPIDSQSPRYDVVAFFNWGRNRRWGALIEESDRNIKINLSEIGLDPKRGYHVTEFWSGEYDGEVNTGFFKAFLKSRTVKVYSFREALDRPQFIGTNRHITQGATDIESIDWNGGDNVLSGKQEVVPGFDYRLTFHAPAGFGFAGAEVDGLKVETEQNGEIIVLKFRDTGPETKTREWKLRFDKK